MTGLSNDFGSLFCLILLAAAGVIINPSVASSEETTPLTQGIERYENRHRNAGETVADPEPVNRSIEHLRTALQSSLPPEEEKKAARYLLRAYYYKGTYVPLSQERKEAVFAAGKDLGQRMMEKYPDSLSIRYGYVINLSRWGQVYGIMAAAREGVAGQIRRHAKTMIDQDPDYQNAAPYRILGIVHHKAPYIPFVLSWPSTEKALQYLGEAVKRAPDEPANRYHYASVLAEAGRKSDALEQLNELEALTVRSSSPVEDRRTFEEAEALRRSLTK